MICIAQSFLYLERGTSPYWEPYDLYKYRISYDLMVLHAAITIGCTCVDINYIVTVGIDYIDTTVSSRRYFLSR